jgi:transcriptional regulator with XRE-family HTH domain
MLETPQLERLRTEPIAQDVGNRVAAAIRLAGVTQRKVATDLGMTEPHLSDICRGRYKTVALETAHKLSEYFGCAIEDLFPRRPEAA